jgi:outer membrane lipoprotein SlyB
MHPLIMIAAAAVILTCLLAIGVMTGIVPSPMNRGDKQDLTGAATSSTTTTLSSPSGTTTRETRTVTRTPVPEPRRLTASPAPAPATGATSGSTSSTVAGAGPAPAPAVACSNCGTVTSVRAVKQQGEASMIGPAAGALLGGVLGRQIGHGSGRTIATVVGAGVGAGAGTEVERRYKSTTHYVVGVRMSDGSHRSFTYASAPNVQAGSKVRVVDGQLVHN